MHLEKAMATHSSTLAWKNPWMEEPGRLQSMGSRRVRHDWATSLSLFTFMHWRRKWQPTPVLLPGESQGWRSVVGCHPWGRYESDITERLHFHFSLSCIGEGNGNPLQCSCLENPRDSGPPSMGSHRVGHDWSNLAAATAAIKQNICMISKQIPVNDTWWSLCLRTTGKTAWKDKSRIKLFFSSLSILNRYTQGASTETKGLLAVAWCAQRALDLN